MALPPKKKLGGGKSRGIFHRRLTEDSSEPKLFGETGWCNAQSYVATLEIYTRGSERKSERWLLNLWTRDCFPPWPMVLLYRLQLTYCRNVYIDLCAELLLAVEINDPFHADIGTNLSKFIRNISMKDIHSLKCAGPPININLSGIEDERQRWDRRNVNYLNYVYEPSDWYFV